MGYNRQANKIYFGPRKTGSGICPSGFYFNNNDCIHISAESANWTDARKTCEYYGSTLCIIKTSTIVDYTESLWKYYNLDKNDGLWVYFYEFYL